ncbi:MAG: hypothetical protein KH235_00330 [Oscillospiraceae bacterium]|nr:hypothetical protein [Oscillospiraceae bacterium]
MVKTGDRVRVADNKNTRRMHEALPEYFPEPGSLGTVDSFTPTTNIYWVEWDNLRDDHSWAFPGRWLELVEAELPNITATVKITRNKERTRVEVDGECGEVLKALAFATASAIHNSASTDAGRNFLLGYFKAALTDAFADTQEADDGTK